MKRRNRKLIGFVAGVFCCTAFSLAANALTLDVAEKSEQPLQEYTDVSRLNAESTMLGWDFETDSSKKEALWGIGENASFAYENGMLVFELENASETVEFVPKGVPDGQAVTAENGRYLVVRLRNLTNGNKMQFWYQTENMTAWDGESCAFTVPIVSGNSTFVTYTVDLSTWKNWSTSSFKTARLCFPGATDGRIELEEVYFTDTRPSGSDEYYSAMTQRFGITPKNGTAITASRTDNWASIIKTNADGSFNFTGSARLENYSVWISPSLPADSSKIKYLVARCSPDFSLQEFVMLLADAENGRFQSWSINSTHYQVKKTGGHAYIIFNLESLGKLQGNIKQIQLFARVLSGTVYDAYWSSTGETADNLVDKAKMYVGADTIDEPLGKTELKSVYRMLNGDEKEVYYEVSDSDIASVVTDGGKTYLYAKNNGDVTLYAKCGDTVFAEKTITVTGQSAEGYNLFFDKNTDDEVSGMPESVKAKGFEAFPQVYPRRDAYRFAGWSLTPDGDAAENVYVAKDTTVYALWEKACSFDFDRQNDDEGFTVENGENTRWSGGALTYMAQAGTVLKSPVLDIDTSEASALLVTATAEACGNNALLRLTVDTTDGTYSYARYAVSDILTEYDFDLKGISGVINGFTLTLSGIPQDGVNVSIDKTEFTDGRILIYDANTDVTVKNMPENIRKAEQIGQDGLTVSSVTPTRAGYVFLFWAASPESKLPVSGKIDATAENSVTLYAVWDKNDHWEFDTYKNSFHPEGISKFSFKNGIFSYNMVSGGSIDNLKNVGYSTDTTSKKLTMRLRWKVDDASGLRAVAAVWTDKVEKYPSSAELSYDISRYGAAPEDFVTIVLDGTSFKYFESNTLKNFRFYPINKPGECEIDYIRFTDSEANIVVSGKLNAASDEVSYIVPESSVIAPNGVAVWKALHLAGGIDFSNGIAVIKGIFEDAGDGGYKAFVLDMDKENVSVADAMQVGDYYVPLINGATYIMPEETDVSFIRQENTTGINVTIEGPDEVFVGDGETAYTAVFDTDMENDSVMWHVDRTDIATVDENGVLTAIKEGAVRLTAISAIDSSINASINVTVSKHIFSLTLKGAENIVVDENTYSYKADFNGDIPKNTAVKYSTDNPDVASIDADSGELTINGAGRVRIVATSAYDPQITAELTVNIRYADFELSIEGPDILKREGRSEKYTAIKTGEHTGKMTYTWTVSDSNKAVISADGKLSPKDNGEITIRAVSNYNPKIFAEKTVTITGQSGLYSVTYHSGTQDAVTGLPETAFGKNSFALSDAVPEREGYYFLGWTLGMDSVTTVTELDLKSDADVYALWGKGVSYEFNGSMDGVTWVMDGSSKLSGNGYMIVNTYGGTRLYMKGMSINPDTHKNIEIRMSVDNKSYVKIYYTAEVDNPDGSVTKLGYANNGYKDAERLSKSLAHSKTGLDNWFTLNFPMYNSYEYENFSTKNMWYKGEADRITGLWIDIGGNKEGTVYVDYIRIPDETREIKFNAGTDETVSGMPENTTAVFGKKHEIYQNPKRDGYRFMGFSLTPGDTENTVSSFMVRDDVTLYAVWSKVYTAEDNRIELGDINGLQDDSVLVKASAGSTVYLYIEGENGSETLSGVPGGTGLVAFDISEYTEVTNAYAYVDNDSAKLYDAIIVSAATAKKQIDKNVVIDPVVAPAMKYDTTVTTVTSDKPLYNAATEAEEEEVVLPDYMGITEPILINFDEPLQAKLFNDYRFAELIGMDESVLSVAVKTESDASVETYPLNVDTASHPYVVMKIRGKDVQTVDLSMNFLTDTMGTRYVTSNNTTDTLTGDWSMLVYDMRNNPYWTGNLKNLRFTFEDAVEDTFSVDWILFTDTLPESFEEIEGVENPFATVNGGAMPFEDVTQEDWFYSKVLTIYRLGFVNGVSENTFAPDGNVTVGQAITLAVRIKAAREGRSFSATAENGEAWYMPYVREAIKQKIITADQFADYDSPISRKACVDVLFKSLPGKCYTAINYYGSISDMDKNDKEYSSVLRMYNAGILTGRDKNHSFYPDSLITRAEISTIIVRMVYESDRERVVTDAERERKRIIFTGKDILDADCYFYCCTPVKPVLDGEIAVTKSNAADPIVFLANLYSFDESAAEWYTKIRIGMKWDTSVVSNPVSYGCGIFFTTANENGFTEDKKIKATWNGKTDENGIGEFVIDLAQNEKTSGIRTFRFDPFDAKDCEFGIAYIIIE